MTLKYGLGKTTLGVPKIMKFQKFAKMSHRGVPGSKSFPKGIQKASKRHPKSVQKASKLIQIKPHWNTNLKIPIQRTAKNLAHYQSFPTNRNKQIGTVAVCAAHW